MKDRLIAKRYAHALLEMVQEVKRVDVVRNDLHMLSEVFKSSAKFSRFLGSVSGNKGKRFSVLKNSFEGKLDEITLRFILFLEQKKRLYLLEVICEVFEKLYLEFKEIVEVRIASHCQLSKQQRDSICVQLEKKLKKIIQPNFEVDPGLIGGIKIQVGDEVYDHSIHTQLEQFKENFIHA